MSGKIDTLKSRDLLVVATYRYWNYDAELVVSASIALAQRKGNFGHCLLISTYILRLQFALVLCV